MANRKALSSKRNRHTGKTNAFKQRVIKDKIATLTDSNGQQYAVARMNPNKIGNSNTAVKLA